MFNPQPSSHWSSGTVSHSPCWLIITRNHSGYFKHSSSRAHPLTSFNLTSLAGYDLTAPFSEKVSQHELLAWVLHQTRPVPWAAWSSLHLCSPPSLGSPHLTVPLSLRHICFCLVTANLDPESIMTTAFSVSSAPSLCLRTCPAIPYPHKFPLKSLSTSTCTSPNSMLGLLP